MVQRTSHNQVPCRHCGELGCDHDKVRVTPGDGKGPAGAYTYQFRCPDGSGRRYTQ